MGQATAGQNKDLLLLSGAPLELEIELLKVDEPGAFEKEVWEMTVMEKFKEGILIMRFSKRFFKLIAS